MKSQKFREFAREFLSENSKEADETEKNGISLTDAEIDLLPANKQKIGDILIVSIPEALSHKKKEIGELLLLFDKKARLVLNDGGIQGQYRIPNREIIGVRFNDLERQSTETIHTENGCRFMSVSMIWKDNLQKQFIQKTAVDLNWTFLKLCFQKEIWKRKSG